MKDKLKKKYLRIDLDSMMEDGYDFYTEYDIGGLGHYIIIKEEDKEKFLDAFSKRWREKAEEAFYLDEDFKDR